MPMRPSRGKAFLHTTVVGTRNEPTFLFIGTAGRAYVELMAAPAVRSALVMAALIWCRS